MSFQPDDSIQGGIAFRIGEIPKHALVGCTAQIWALCESYGIDHEQLSQKSRQFVLNLYIQGAIGVTLQKDGWCRDLRRFITKLDHESNRRERESGDQGTEVEDSPAPE